MPSKLHYSMKSCDSQHTPKSFHTAVWSALAEQLVHRCSRSKSGQSGCDMIAGDDASLNQGVSADETLKPWENQSLRQFFIGWCRRQHHNFPSLFSLRLHSSEPPSDSTFEPLECRENPDGKYSLFYRNERLLICDGCASLITVQDPAPNENVSKCHEATCPHCSFKTILGPLRRILALTPFDPGYNFERDVALEIIIEANGVSGKNVALAKFATNCARREEARQALLDIIGLRVAFESAVHIAWPLPVAIVKSAVDEGSAMLNKVIATKYGGRGENNALTSGAIENLMNSFLLQQEERGGDDSCEKVNGSQDQVEGAIDGALEEFRKMEERRNQTSMLLRPSGAEKKGSGGSELDLDQSATLEFFFSEGGVYAAWKVREARDNIRKHAALCNTCFRK